MLYNGENIMVLEYNGDNSVAQYCIRLHCMVLCCIVLIILVAVGLPAEKDSSQRAHEASTSHSRWQSRTANGRRD
jgi:hypothetical protein